jgi:site-specific DNA-methyltransferase (adenine-specific)
MKVGTQRAAQDGPGSVCYGTYGGNTTKKDIKASCGSAARFFYCAKASHRDRNEGIEIPSRRDRGFGPEVQGNFHPTVKPTDLMRYLCRLVTPPDGVVLDPFMGSGSTGKAALLEGFRFIGIELSADYVDIARARMEHASRQGHRSTLPEAA